MSFGKGGGGGGGAIPSFNPQALIEQQAKENRITQFTPSGNLIFGEVDGNGQFVPSRGDQRAALLEETPFQNRFRQGAEDIATILQESAAPRIQNLPLSPIDTTVLPSRNFALDTNGLATLPGTDDFGAERQRVEQSQFDRAMSLLDPVFDRQETRLNQDLANQGIPIGSEIFNDRFDVFNKSRNEVLQNTALDAVAAGGQEQSRLFGLASAARGQGLQEQLTTEGFSNTVRAQALQEQQSLRSTELGELASILGLQPVQQSNIGNFFPPSPVDVTGPHQLAQNAAIAQAQIAQANRSSSLGALAALGTAGMFAFGGGGGGFTGRNPFAGGVPPAVA